MNSIRPYIAVLHQQFLNSFAKMMAFRVSMIIAASVEISVFLTFYLTANFLFNHIDTIGTWRRPEFMFFTFWYLMVMSTHNAFLAPNFWNFSMEIRTGNLDFRLLRPLGSLFDVFTAIQRPTSIMMLPIHIGFLIYYGAQAHLTGLSWTLLLPLLLLSFSLVALVEMAIAMTVFWTKGGEGLNFIRMQSQQFQRWPDFMFPDGIRRFFSSVIPILIALSFPVRFALNNTEWRGVLATALASIIFWFVVRLMWREGLKRYESASS
jgi:ABC-2 type transport system permease protein